MGCGVYLGPERSDGEEWGWGQVRWGEEKGWGKGWGCRGGPTVADTHTREIWQVCGGQGKGEKERKETATKSKMTVNNKY